MVLAIMVLYIVSSILFTRHFLIGLKKNYYTEKMVCYLLHTAVCYFSNKCVKFLIQHIKCAEMTHYTLGQLFNTLHFCA